MVMIRSTRLLAAMLAIIVISSACGDDPVSSTDGPAESSLSGREFWATSVAEAGSEHVLVAGTRIAVEFDDGTIGASAGCNAMGGSYSLDADVLIVEEMSMTEMGCDPERHQQDQFVAGLLMARPTITLDDDVLTLTTDEIVVVLLDREVADPDRPIIGTQWSVTGFIQGEVAMSMSVEIAGFIVFDDQSSMRGHDGCTGFTASVEVSDGSTGGPVEGDGEVQFGSRQPAIDATEECGGPTEYTDAFNELFATGDAYFEIDGANLTMLNRDGNGVTFRDSGE